MSVHPVTPMAEADLRDHLAMQTQQSVGLVDIMTLREGKGDQRVEEAVAGGATMLLFDVLDDASLAEVGRLLWKRRRKEPTFVIGSSCVEYALVAHWQAIGLVEKPTVPPSAEPCRVQK